MGEVTAIRRWSIVRFQHVFTAFTRRKLISFYTSKYPLPRDEIVLLRVEISAASPRLDGFSGSLISRLFVIPHCSLLACLLLSSVLEVRTDQTSTLHSSFHDHLSYSLIAWRLFTQSNTLISNGFSHFLPSFFHSFSFSKRELLDAVV